MRFTGEKATYETIKELGGGQSGQTFLAAVLEVHDSDADPSLNLCLHEEVVIKIPKLLNGPIEDRYDALGNLHRLANAEILNFQRLRGLQCVAAVLDQGLWHVNLNERGDKATVVFIVQQLINGLGLDEHLTPKESTRPCAVGSAAEFFDWARRLARALDSVHRRQVIHGDIWPANIRVRGDGEPVFIDFGQAIFRDLVFDIGQISGRNRAYMAPEGARSVSGDIYSIGGVLHLLATGKDPFPPVEDIDEVKDLVTRIVLDNNPKLYRENCGVVDVIARCLRFSRHGRTPHAAALMEDIATFDRRDLGAEAPKPDGELRSIDSSVTLLRDSRSPFFLFAATLQLRRIAGDLADMANGNWDLIGDHETIVSALTQFIAGLQAGDQYFTVSTSTFWLPQNLGVNGRFLSMNRLAAQDGAVIRRVFLVTEHEIDTDCHLRRVLRTHLREMDDLEKTGVTTAKSAIEEGGYFTGVRIVPEKERDDRLRRGEHYGLIVRGSARVIMYPIYREDRKLVALQFRSGPATEGRIEQLRSALEKARPLSDFRQRIQDAG
ncbi:MAG: phosphotransferase [Bacteroidota bacterium]